MKKRKILAVTGIRSEYDLFYPVLDAIRNHSKSLELNIVVCGAHLSPWHGSTIKYIEGDNFKIVDKIEYLLDGNSDSTRAKGIGILITGLVQTIKRINPDLLLVGGDREEPLATAIIGNYLKIPVAHIFGGDPVYGNSDDPVRHAISKMVHIHFTACEDHRKRLIKMGEEPFRIFNVGNPALDRIRTTPHLNRKELSKILNFDIGKHEPLIIILQHPLSSESESAYKQMKITMESVKELGIKAVVIYPNTDPGSYNIVTVIEEYHDLPNVKICKNLKRLEFVNLMRHASCLVGNSSCGLVEAPFLELPAINIGNRQKGRLNAGNVIFVPHKKEIIVDIIKKVVFNKNFRKKLINNIDNIYGDGHTKEKIVNVLEKIKINNKLLIKRNTY